VLVLTYALIVYSQQAMAKEYVAAARHTIQVDFVDYCDELASVRARSRTLIF